MIDIVRADGFVAHDVRPLVRLGVQIVAEQNGRRETGYHGLGGRYLYGRLFEDAVEAYAARHRVKPGITGWAQIHGLRGETDTIEKLRRRVEFDLYYIENWSVVFDLFILLKTPLALMTKSENAY